MNEPWLLVIGIGNPGPRYEETRHNIGFQVLRELALRHKISLNQSRFESVAGSGEISGRKLWLALPQTYVNLSGRSVLGFSSFFKILPEQIFVVCDDVALPLGRLRVRGGGSSGGHNGLKSIEAVLATQEYPRLRVGVGAAKHGDLVGHVLGRFSDEEWPFVDQAVKHSADAVETWLQGGLEVAMRKYNGLNLASPARPGANDSSLGDGAAGSEGK